MKKIAVLLTMAVSISLFGCGPTTSSPTGTNPSGTPTVAPTGSPTGTTDIISTKAAFITYLNCIKALPSIASNAGAVANVDATIATVNNISDADWAASKPIFSSTIVAYAALGCK